MVIFQREKKGRFDTHHAILFPLLLDFRVSWVLIFWVSLAFSVSWLLGLSVSGFLSFRTAWFLGLLVARFFACGVSFVLNLALLFSSLRHTPWEREWASTSSPSWCSISEANARAQLKLSKKYLPSCTTVLLALQKGS